MINSLFRSSTPTSSSGRAASSSTPTNKESSSNESVAKEELEDGSKSILLDLLAQLRKGTDLHRVTLPTFVLEPRSMLERVTDFFLHPELIIDTPKKADPVERFVDVVRFFLSGWHIRPQGVKKPYNPVLGENFRCRWNYAGSGNSEATEAFYVAEQVSHHPPISCWFFAAPENNVIMTGDVKPSSKFLGNSAMTMMDGETRIYFSNYEDEVYVLNSPNVYARGLLFGSMYMELGDTVTIKCPKNDLVCTVDFRTKGYFSGGYNHISGKVKNAKSGELLYELSGKWTDTMYIKRVSKNVFTPDQTLFDATQWKAHPMVVAPEDDQEIFESRRLWRHVTRCIRSRDLDKATEHKNVIEDGQRARARWAVEHGKRFQPRFFVPEDHLVALVGCSINSVVATSPHESDSDRDSVKSERSAPVLHSPTPAPPPYVHPLRNNRTQGTLPVPEVNSGSRSYTASPAQGVTGSGHIPRSASMFDKGFSIGPGSPAAIMQKRTTNKEVSGYVSEPEDSSFNNAGADYFHFIITEFPADPKACKEYLEKAIFMEPPKHFYLSAEEAPLPEQ